MSSERNLTFDGARKRLTYAVSYLLISPLFPVTVRPMMGPDVGLSKARRLAPLVRCFGPPGTLVKKSLEYV